MNTVSKNTSDQITFLQESLKDSQQTLRLSTRDSTDQKYQLREKLHTLDSIVESLTVPQNRSINLDARSNRVPRMNAPIRGASAWKYEESDSICSPLKLKPVVSVRPLKLTPQSKNKITKHSRRRKTYGESIGSSVKDSLNSHRGARASLPLLSDSLLSSVSSHF